MKHIFAMLLLFMVAGISAQTTQPKTQCTALTTKGLQCKKNATVNGACTIHSTNAARCGATTSKGLPCKMRVKAIGDKCHNHNH